MRKFVVIAAHSVTMKNASLRRTNLMFRAPCSGFRLSDRYPFGFKWRSITPQSGTS